VSSPPVDPPWACADGLGRVRWFRARRLPAGFLVLAASFLFLGPISSVQAQFPIRQFPRTFGTPPTAVPANALPGHFASNGPAQSGAHQPAAQQSQPPPHPAIARIVVPEKDGISYGSGTLVDARGQFGLVVTNWHVVRDAAGTITAEFPGGFKSPAQVVKTDKDWDLAALSVYRPQATPLPVTATAPQPGEWLTIAGYGGGDWRTATGKCTQYLAPGVDFPHEMVELSAEARQGDSGGPILNHRGEVAGVLFGSGPGYTSGSYGGRVLQFLATVIPGGMPGSDAAPTPTGLAHQPQPSAGPQPSANPAYGAGPPVPPQSTALHAIKPPASLPEDAWADRSSAKPPLDIAALTPALQPTNNPLLTPPPKNEMSDRFGPQPRASIADEVDPRVAVIPDRLAAATATLSPDLPSLSAAPPALPHVPLPPRIHTGATGTVDLNQAPPNQLLAAVWRKLGGTTLFDQTKSILAIVGMLAVAVVLWRIGGHKEAESYDE
jgi:serine protease Do